MTMKSWIAFAVVLVPLTTPVWALPRPSPGAEGGSSTGGVQSYKIGEAKGVDVSRGIVLLGGAALGVVGGVALRQPAINKLKQLKQLHEYDLQHNQFVIDRLRASKESMKQQLEQHLEPPSILLRPHVHDQLLQWNIPQDIARDAVWMECIYGLTRTPEGGTSTSAWALGDAIVDCANIHRRSFDPRWFDLFHQDGIVRIARSARRASAWAESESRADEAIEAAGPEGLGHFRKQTGHSAEFSISPLAGVVRPWSRRVGINAKHVLAALQASARHFPAYGSHLLQEEVRLLKKEAAVAF
ncbi:MAG: hypothetical protein M1826_006040 [Phylliscum demangeonii]|nr:MAG: hypothetical protein M1826_006040 [Phylliscum demangeonii]